MVFSAPTLDKTQSNRAVFGKIVYSLKTLVDVLLQETVEVAVVGLLLLVML